MANNFFLNHDADDDNTLDMNVNNTESADEADIWSFDDDSDFDDAVTSVHTYDTDLDGVDDVAIEEIDLDGDGYADITTVLADNDGDGIFDTAIQEADLNFDGQSDVLHALQDLDGDGLADTEIFQADVDFDGNVDVEAVAEDTNFDGTADNFEAVVNSGDDSYFFQATDLDFDGKIDTFNFTTQPVDDPVDGQEDEQVEVQPEEQEENDIVPEDDDFEETDHEEDSDVIFTPPENDNVAPTHNDDPVDSEDPIDTEDPVDTEDPNPEYIVNPEEDDNELPYIDLEELGYDDDNDNGIYIDDLDNFDPASSDPDQVVGDPEEAMGFWEYQGGTNRCAIFAQKFVIEEYTGEEVDVEELCDIAEENGWFTEGGGTRGDCMGELLDYYGVPNEESTGNDINDIIEALDEDHKVIVSVDAEEYWYGENDNIYTPGDGVNHAIEVIGFDNSDPENPVVIVNDSGNPDGCGCEIPLDTFMDAWEDGGCHMIECM